MAVPCASLVNDRTIPAAARTAVTVPPGPVRRWRESADGERDQGGPGAEEAERQGSREGEGDEVEYGSGDAAVLNRRGGQEPPDLPLLDGLGLAGKSVVEGRGDQSDQGRDCHDQPQHDGPGERRMLPGIPFG